MQTTLRRVNISSQKFYNFQLRIFVSIDACRSKRPENGTLWDLLPIEVKTDNPRADAGVTDWGRKGNAREVNTRSTSGYRRKSSPPNIKLHNRKGRKLHDRPWLGPRDYWHVNIARAAGGQLHPGSHFPSCRKPRNTWAFVAEIAYEVILGLNSLHIHNAFVDSWRHMLLWVRKT